MAPRSLFCALNCGFILIEILISMLLVAIGMGGAMKLQIASIQATQQAIYMNAASAFATDMADRMMGNAETLTRPATNPYLQVNFRAGQKQIIPASACHQNQCTPDQLAAADISEWLQAINEALPEVHAVICQDDGADVFNWDCHSGNGHSEIVIKLGWADKNETQKIPTPRLVIPVFTFNG